MIFTDNTAVSYNHVLQHYAKEFQNDNSILQINISGLFLRIEL